MDDGEQQLTCRNVGVLIVENILQLMIQGRIRQMVSPEEGVFLTFCLLAVLLHAFLPKFPLLLGEMQLELVLAFL